MFHQYLFWIFRNPEVHYLSVSLFITTVLSNQDSLIGIGEVTVMNRDCCTDIIHWKIELGLRYDRSRKSKTPKPKKQNQQNQKNKKNKTKKKKQKNKTKKNKKKQNQKKQKNIISKLSHL